MSYSSYKKEELPGFIKRTIKDIELYHQEYLRGIDYQSVLDFLNYIYDETGMKIGGR